MIQDVQKAPLRLIDRKTIWIALFIFLIWGLFYRVYQYDFIGYDDVAFVPGNPMVMRGLSFETIWWALTTFEMAHWHPLVWISYQIEVSLFGPQPGIMHLSNVVLHTFNTILLFFFLVKATRSTSLSGIVSVLFAIHPLHVEAVVWLSARKDLLCTLFTLSALSTYVSHVQIGKRSYYYASLAFYLMGMMSKSMIVTLPALLILLDFWPLERFKEKPSDDKRSKKEPWLFMSSLLKEKSLYFLMTIAFCVIAFIPQDFFGAVSNIVIPVHKQDYLIRIGQMLHAYGGYLCKTFWPVDLYIPYLRPATFSISYSLVSLLILFSITVYVIIKRKVSPYLFFGWTWFCITLLPVSGVVIFGQHHMADRYTYVPHIGLFIMIVWPLEKFWPYSNRIKPLMAILSGIVGLMLCMQSWTQIGYWRNDGSLFNHTLSMDPDNAAAHHALGRYSEIVLEDEEKALKHYEAALSSNPRSVVTHNSLGHVYWMKQKFGEAEKHFLIALQLKEKDAGTHINLANIYILKNQVPKAMAHISRALVLDPSNADAFNTLGVMLVEKNDLQKAKIYFEKALKSQPQLETAKRNLEKVNEKIRLNGTL